MKPPSYSAPSPHRPTRRTFLLSMLGAGLAAASWGLAEPFVLRLEQRDVLLPDLPPSLDGLRVALITDTHIGNFAGPGLAERAGAMAAEARPDLLLLGGDLVHDWASDQTLAATARAFGRLRAPLGVFGVLGNHDYGAGAERVRAAMEEAGVPILVNEGRKLAEGLWLAGVDDCLAGSPDLARAMQGAPPGGCRLLLAHEPDFADQAALQTGDALHLQFSGHSHGGQVRLPGVGPIVLPPMSDRYPAGLQRVPGRRLQVYTSRGVGVTGPPVRFLCPPEVSLLRLRRVPL